TATWSAISLSWHRARGVPPRAAHALRAPARPSARPDAANHGRLTRALTAARRGSWILRARSWNALAVLPGPCTRDSGEGAIRGSDKNSETAAIRQNRAVSDGSSRHLAASLPPAGDDHLLVGVELDRIAAVRLEVAEEALLGAAEREERHRRRDA